MTEEEFYGPALTGMKWAEQTILNIAGAYEWERGQAENGRTILYQTSRIKTPESMRNKLKSRKLETDAHSALTQVHDAVGVRIVCAFSDDVYKVADWLKTRPEFRVVMTKDYFAHPKPNGYRSYHMIVLLPTPQGEELSAEIQIRTIATDFWATLEHQLKYKRQVAHEELIRSELKRCADEIASVDLSMQTIRDMIQGEDKNQE
ncbi:MAG TPA: RelA/SpoT domain protein [Candidatus Caccomorpha excrementavium]|nr:RelA/SpoT domain protein [Candidatus Caccomorpha excrementavium]